MTDIRPVAIGDGEAVLTFVPPTTPLSTNQANTLHWAKRRRLLDPWKDLTTYYGRQLAGRGWKPVPVTIAVSLPFRTQRRRDAHNYTGTVVKAVVDGLVAGGVIPDDTPEWATITDSTLSIQPDKGAPLVATVTITPRS